MALTTEQLVQQIHDRPMRIVLAAAGGGSRAIADLLEVPGASRALLEAIVPYAAGAMAAFLGRPPPESCSAATARAMALAAFYRARQYQAEPGEIAGVACTASLASDRPKRGPHRMHIAVQTAPVTAAWRLELQKGRRSRTEEERLAGQLLLNVVAEACGVPERLEFDLLEGERVEHARTEAAPAWQDLLLGEAAVVRTGPDHDPAGLIFPGAFNPWHAGHERMASIAQATLGQPMALEISICNVDKLPLDYIEIEHRLAQFRSEQTIYLTRAATFEEKSRLFPGATFVLGADTLRRIADSKYHGRDPAVWLAALEQIAARGCRFLVFCRRQNGQLLRLADLELPAILRPLCREIPPEVFCQDVCSTELRNAADSEGATAS